MPAKIVANAAQRAAVQARRGSLFADMTPSADDYRRFQSPAELKDSTKSPKATAVFLLKFPVKLTFQAKQFQTKQRRKTFAKRGEEIGLKEVSQPTGTRARDCDCSGVTGGRNSCCQAVGFAVGRRSPLSARFTDAAGVELNPTPVVDNEGKETRLAVTNANATAATRNDHMLSIGVSPKSRQPPEIPTTPMSRLREAVWPRTIKTWRPERGSAMRRKIYRVVIPLTPA